MPLNLTFDDADQDLVNLWELTDGTSLDTPAGDGGSLNRLRPLSHYGFPTNFDACI